jgi:hypothetical protein
VYEPIVAALRAVKFDIVRVPARSDRNLMAVSLERHSVLITRDVGIPSQAYAFQYAQNGLTVVLLRWKESNPKAWQQIVASILTHAEEWERMAAQAPSIISVSQRGYRSRTWQTIPSSIAEAATQLLLEPMGTETTPPDGPDVKG